MKTFLYFFLGMLAAVLGWLLYVFNQKPYPIFKGPDYSEFVRRVFGGRSELFDSIPFRPVDALRNYGARRYNLPKTKWKKN